jgi:hypothetical protein
MRRSFRIVGATASPAEIEAVQRDYPTVAPMTDGSPGRSRLKEGDSSIGPAYELPYGWYAPGNPKEVLPALVLLSRDEAPDFLTLSHLPIRSDGFPIAWERSLSHGD